MVSENFTKTDSEAISTIMSKFRASAKVSQGSDAERFDKIVGPNLKNYIELLIRNGFADFKKVLDDFYNNVKEQFHMNKNKTISSEESPEDVKKNV